MISLSIIVAADPSVTQVIPADDDRPVVGVTSVNNQLFVLRALSRQEIEVYDTHTFTFLRKLRVDGLSDDISWWNSLTSCGSNCCLYVGVYSLCTVNKIELTTGDKLSMWKVGSGPSGLSVNSANNVLVTCSLDYKIQEYTGDGQLIRVIEIKKPSNLIDELSSPLHTIQLTDGQLVFCHWGPYPGDVSALDKQGQVVVSYKNNKQSTDKPMFGPRHLAAVDKYNCILVADAGNKRVVMLNSSLSCARDLPVSLDGGLKGPRCLHYDESRGRLLIGEYSGKRVIVVDDVMLFSVDFS